MYKGGKKWNKYSKDLAEDWLTLIFAHIPALPRRVAVFA